MIAAESAIDGTGWLLVAVAGLMLVSATLYLLFVWAEDYPDPVEWERADQPNGFRVLGPVVRPPFDWSEYPEFAAAAWRDDDLDPDERWYALHDGWVDNDAR